MTRHGVKNKIYGMLNDKYNIIFSKTWVPIWEGVEGGKNQSQ